MLMDASFLSSLTLATLSVSRHPGRVVSCGSGPQLVVVVYLPVLRLVLPDLQHETVFQPATTTVWQTDLLILLTTSWSGLESSSVPVVKHNY